MSLPADRTLDASRILRTLDRHGVEYLLVGGVAAELYGASRPTFDVDCLPKRSDANLDRLADAMGELGARLRVSGLTDVEAKGLPTHIDRFTLAGMEISTWTTDAGDLDVLADLPDRHGRHLGYEELSARSTVVRFADITVRLAALDDLIASKEWANRPKDREALPELHELHKGRSDPKRNR